MVRPRIEEERTKRCSNDFAGELGSLASRLRGIPSMLAMLARTPSRPLSLPGGGVWSRVGLLAAGFLVALGLLASSAFAGQLPVRLGAADSFAVLGGQTVTNSGRSTLNGDLGVSPGSALTGFPPGRVNGRVHAGDPVASQAQSDLTTAYDDAAGRTPPQALPADVGGRTLAPGVYRSGGALGLTGALTLDGQGDPNAVFVFQVGSTLTTSVVSRVDLINGAKYCNVFWQIGSSATLGTSSAFAGDILALTSISLKYGVTLNGRALARNGSVTLINDTITAPHCAQAGRGGGGGFAGGPKATPKHVGGLNGGRRPGECSRPHHSWGDFTRAWPSGRGHDPAFAGLWLPDCRLFSGGLVDHSLPLDGHGPPPPNDHATSIPVTSLVSGKLWPLVDAENDLLAYMRYAAVSHQLQFFQANRRRTRLPWTVRIPRGTTHLRGPQPALGLSRGCMINPRDRRHALLIVLNTRLKGSSRPTRAFMQLAAISGRTRGAVTREIGQRPLGCNNLGANGKPEVGPIRAELPWHPLAPISGGYFGTNGPGHDANGNPNGGMYPSAGPRDFYTNRPAGTQKGPGPSVAAIYASTTAVSRGGIIRSVISGRDTVAPIALLSYADPNACDSPPHVSWEYVQVIHDDNPTQIFGFSPVNYASPSPKSFKPYRCRRTGSTHHAAGRRGAHRRRPAAHRAPRHAAPGHRPRLRRPPTAPHRGHR